MDIAKAYVQVIPSAEGIKGNLETVFKAEGASSGSSFNAGFGATIKKLATGAAVVGAIKGIATIGKNAVTAYADYEQLVGGVETLFGDAGSQTITKNAADAFKTAGLSANDYMETVTSFSAALIAGMGGDTAAAADAANMAIQDMADNANKMGSDIESIQNAYQGFAKQQYTLLDNLKLGYGGTKGEMERLLADASELSGQEYSIDNLNDVYEAIHVIQSEMGITGTTAQEAEATISGSLAMTKASWDNLIAAIAGGGDLSAAISNLVSSATSFAGNLLPVVQQVMTGLVNAIVEMAPQISAFIPACVDILVANLPALIDVGVTLFTALVNALPVAIPAIVAALPTIVDAMANALMTALPQMLAAGIELIIAIAKAIPTVIPQIVSSLMDAGAQMIRTVIEFVPQMLSAGINLVQGLIDGVDQMISAVIAKIVSMGESIVQTIKNFLGIKSPSREMMKIGRFIDAGLAEGIAGNTGLVTNAVNRLGAATLNGFGMSIGMDDGWDIAGRNAVQINISTQQLSDQEIDYVINMANQRLGGLI